MSAFGGKADMAFCEISLGLPRELRSRHNMCGGYITNATNLRATIVNLLQQVESREPIFDCFGLMEEERAKVKGANHE